MTEIERKFLVTGEYKHLALSANRIAQGYICHGHGHTVRVRIYGEKAFLTIKGPSYDNGLSRFEWEKEITLKDAKELMQLCTSGLVEKTRYLVRSGRHTVEVDEFHGANEGLVLAEIELASPDEKYVKPDFLGEEVTGNPIYYNAFLSEHPFTTWSV